MITGVLADNSTLAVSKSDGGVWVLAPTAQNTFTGATTFGGGLLGLSALGMSPNSAWSFNNGGVFAYGGALSTGTGVTIGANQTAMFAGSYAISLTGTITGTNGNPWTINNSMDNGAVLTLGNFVAGNETTSRTLNIRGYGSTVFTGTISNNSTNQTAVDIRIANNATVTMGSISGFSGGLLLYQGILVANNPTVVAGTSVLGATGALFTFGGGELRSNFAMTGANAFQNPVSLTGDPAVVSGTSSIGFAGTLTTGGKVLQNDITGGGSLIVSGSVNTASNLTLQGGAFTQISGSLYGSGAVVYQGSGTLSLTGANTQTGAFTINRGLVALSGTTGGSLNSISGLTLLAGGTLRLNDSGGVNAAGRLGAGTLITSSGGLLDFVGNSGTLQFGSLTANLTSTALNMANAGSVTFAGITLSNTGSSLDLTSIGSLGVSGGRNVLLSGTTGLTFLNSVLPRIVIGSDFATYDGTLGFKAFSGYNAAALDSLVLTDTGSLTGTGALAQTRSINALKLTAGTVSSGSQALSLTSGALLATGGSSTLTLAQLTSPTNPMFVQVSPNSSLTFNAPLNTSTQGFSKLQSGTLRLTQH